MDTKKIKQSLMDAHELILDADFELMMAEDYAYGEEGRKITEVRGNIQELLKKTNDLLLKIDLALKVLE